MNAVDNETSMIRVRIRELREAREWTQEIVVYQLNCLAGYQAFSVSGYKKIERDIITKGLNSINLHLLDKLCELYQCSITDILARD